MRPARVFVALLLVYVALDLASPLVPGAFAFDPDDCVEGFRAHRLRTPVPSLGPVVARVPHGKDVARLATRPEPAVAPVVARAFRVAPLPRAELAGARGSSSPPDDH